METHESVEVVSGLAVSGLVVIGLVVAPWRRGDNCYDSSVGGASPWRRWSFS